MKSPVHSRGGSLARQESPLGSHTSTVLYEPQSKLLRDSAKNSRNPTFFLLSCKYNFEIYNTEMQSVHIRIPIQVAARCSEELPKSHFFCCRASIVSKYNTEMQSVHIRSQIQVAARFSEELPKSDVFFAVVQV